MEPFELTAAAAAAAQRNGELSAQDLVRSCLERISALEETVGAWAHLDADYALEQARQADRLRGEGGAIGPLHGLPVGIKDIFDTRDMPTENGTPLNFGRAPSEDATVVALLREAGAVIMGKTVTTELAVYAPGKTRNPHNPEHTPGGSSSGSAAAVAAGMVPLAVGSQTNGSVIRPAAYCGVYGFKPSYGRISRHNVLAQSRPLDTVGVFARSVEDLALIGDCVMAYDDRDPDMRPAARPQLSNIAIQDPPLPPVFAFVKSPVWDQAEDASRAAFAELTGLLGEACDEVALPEVFDGAVGWHRAIMYADLAKSFAALYARGKDQLSDILRGMIEEGQSILAVDYNAAVDWTHVLNAGLERIFERYDAILTPATAGEAPAGLEATGSPIFCTLWTLCGLPAVSLPLLEGASGLPLGVQLVGRRGDDARLLRSARALAERIQGEAQD
jgi:Asp-tRNA(Asn)/Glu-tRNA(Gln) amidotransferase A subunit family amidase